MPGDRVTDSSNPRPASHGSLGVLAQPAALWLFPTLFGITTLPLLDNIFAELMLTFGLLVLGVICLTTIAASLVIAAVRRRVGPLRVCRAFLIAFLIAATWSVGWLRVADATGVSRHHPTEDELISRFEANRSAFDELADRLRAAHATGRKPQLAFFARDARDAPSAEIHRLAYSTLQLRHVAVRDDLVELNTYARGIVPSGFARGFVHTRTAPRDVVESIDGVRLPPEGRSHYTIYRHVVDGWYVYHEQW